MDRPLESVARLWVVAAFEASTILGWSVAAGKDAQVFTEAGSPRRGWFLAFRA